MAMIQNDFNPRPPRGGRHGAAHHALRPQTISIHAPREGGDKLDHDSTSLRCNFNPRPPRGGRPEAPEELRRSLISIHAPREGGDIGANQMYYTARISIHAPREGGDSKDAQFYLWIFDK